jgi:hypothetical protein
MKYDRPSDENHESLYLEELFGEKEYSNSSNQKSGITRVYISKDDKNSSGKRHYSTIRNYSSSCDAEPEYVKSKILTKFISSKDLKPQFVFEDLHKVTIRKKISQDTRDLSGVYLILNKVTLDYYVGSASTNRFYSRFYNHLIGFSGSKVVKNAVRKYKLPNFCFLVLELFPEVVTQTTNKNLLDL